MTPRFPKWKLAFASEFFYMMTSWPHFLDRMRNQKIDGFKSKAEQRPVWAGLFCYSKFSAWSGLSPRLSSVFACFFDPGQPFSFSSSLSWLCFDPLWSLAGSILIFTQCCWMNFIPPLLLLVLPLPRGCPLDYDISSRKVLMGGCTLVASGIRASVTLGLHLADWVMPGIEFMAHVYQADSVPLSHIPGPWVSWYYCIWIKLFF